MGPPGWDDFDQDFYPPPTVREFKCFINTTRVFDPAFNRTTPAAPGGGVNVVWQSQSAASPTGAGNLVSGYVELASFTGRWLRRTIYSSGSGNHSPGSDCSEMDVLAVAGGGGGGGADHGAAQSAAGGGGAAGSACFKRFTGVSGTYAYAVGAGGAGGAAGPNNGTAGGDSTFSTLTAKGGNGGTGGALSGAAAFVLGGSATVSTGGDWNGRGQAGFFAIILAAAGPVCGGQGGSNLMGGGGAARTSQAAGLAGAGPGAGGGGGLTINGGGPGTTKAGGDGQNGIIIVDEYS